MVFNLMSSQCLHPLNPLKNNIPVEMMDFYDKVYLCMMIILFSQFNSTQIFMVWIEYCKRLRDDNGEQVAYSELEKLFLILQRSELFISRRLATELINYDRSRHSNTKIFSINNDFSSKCQHCGEVLNKYLMADQTRQNMMEIIMNFVLRKNDIYQKTSPLELQKFLGFLNKNKPFDLVVDQPNVSFKPIGQRHSNMFNQSRNLYETVKHFSDLGWNTLLVCRPEIKRFHHFRKLSGLR